MGLRGAALLLCSLLPGAPAAADGAGCELEAWLSQRPAPGGGEDGYHVVCALNASVALVYQGGVASEAPLRVDLVSDGRDVLRENLGVVQRFGGTIRYQVPGRLKRVLEVKKRPWVLFSVKGVQLPVGEEAELLARAFRGRQRPVTLLLFEGGAWRWPTIRLGYVRPVARGIEITTVSRQPAVFEVTMDRDEADGDRLSARLLSDVVEVARPRLAESAGYDGIRNSQQTFFDYDSDPKLQRLREGTAFLARVPEENLEPLQVVRYEVDQHYNAHRDYWDPREFPDGRMFTDAEGHWRQRHATLLWYLQAPGSGGQTWFPRAHGGPIPHGEWLACDARGASVHPTNATAVLFYNLKADGDIDEYSWHSGCNVTAGVKWAANSWIHNGAVFPPIAKKLRGPGGGDGEDADEWPSMTSKEL